MAGEAITHPRVGLVATVRNRRGVIAAVEPYETRPEGLLHLVRIEYADADGPLEEHLIWEREPGRSLLEPNALPRVEAEPPMQRDDFDALVRSARWSALTPFLGPDGSPQPANARPIAAPWFGAVQVDDFQLVPLLQALQMPRISLLLADDVGLGKTVEAGLILAELLLRRRIRRVLVLTPASLRDQWVQEMRDKFALSFDVVDRDETHALHSRMGLDANPWRVYPRIVSSYYYLRQPDILEQFEAASRLETGAYHLPWDLLIVDEAHNLMPSNFGRDSELCEMLRRLTPLFEHKLFLTATPHNGHARCFSGLLELLDPVRFTQKPELTDADRQRISQVVVRRLKREINALDDKTGRPRRFAERYVHPEPVYFAKAERALAGAFGEFRKAVKSAVARGKHGEELAGNFAVEVLNKRLLSCPYTFADSWHRFKDGLVEDELAEAVEVAAATRASEELLDDDLELQGRARHAARTAGAWLKPLKDQLATQIAAVDAALNGLALNLDGERVHHPKEDARFDRLTQAIDERLRRDREWLPDERMIVFTEYKTSQDYLLERLRQRYADNGTVITALFGGMDRKTRDGIKEAFNDPESKVRLLVATDAASEGLNLQETARFVFHFEIPWNPSRLEQRNGRLDRHGQARDVTVFHFTSEDDADLRFLGKVVGKVHNIREDLGSMGEVFDAAFQRRFADLDDADEVDAQLELEIERHRDRAAVPRDRLDEKAAEATTRLDILRKSAGLAPLHLRATLAGAMRATGGATCLEPEDARGRTRLKQPFPPRWEALIDDTVRLAADTGARGALPSLVFDPAAFVVMAGTRPVFRPAKDARLMHLGHPLLRESLATFARLRYPGGSSTGFVAPSRWTVLVGGVAPGDDATLLLTVEELAVNELREPFHHWVRTLAFPVRGGRLGAACPVPGPDDVRTATAPTSPNHQARAGQIWDDIAPDLRDAITAWRDTLTKTIGAQLAGTKSASLKEEKQRYEERLKEVEAAMKETTLNRLERERDKALAELAKGKLFAEHVNELRTQLRNLEEELDRRRNHYKELLNFLKVDQERVLTQMLPRRFALKGDVQVFPVALEIRLPEGGA